MSASDWIPLTLDALLAAGILLVFVTDLVLGSRRETGWLTAGLLAGLFVGSFYVDTSGSALGGAYQGGAWPLFFKRVFLATGFLATLGSIDHVAARQPDRQGEYYLLLLFSLLGMMLLPGARDVIFLVVCFELMGIPLYLLAAFAKTDEGRRPTRNGPEAALKLYLVGVASTAVTLFGLSLVFGLSGSTRIEAIVLTPSSPLLVVGMAMVLAGMGFKIGVVPFHFWVPDTYEGASTPFVSFLSVAPKIAGFAALCTLFLDAFARHRAEWLPLVLALSAMTIVAGNLLALPQRNVKRLLAFSGVAHIGYMLMAFAAEGAYGAGMLLFYAAAYAATNVGAFLVVEAVSSSGGRASGVEDGIDTFDGLARRSPWLGLAMLLFLLSLAGIPFVVGFWAKLYVFMAAWQAGFAWLVLLGALLAIVALFYYMRIARAMFMNAPREDAPVRPPPALTAGILLCLLAVVAMGLYPAPFIQSAIDAAAPFFG